MKLLIAKLWISGNKRSELLIIKLKTVEQRVGLLVIWNVISLIWCYCDDPVLYTLDILKTFFSWLWGTPKGQSIAHPMSVIYGCHFSSICNLCFNTGIDVLSALPCIIGPWYLGSLALVICPSNLLSDSCEFLSILKQEHLVVRHEMIPCSQLVADQCLRLQVLFISKCQRWQNIFSAMEPVWNQQAITMSS